MACVYIPTPVLGIIKVLLIWFFFTCMCAVVTFSLSRQYIIDNWSEYKCNPLVTPFAAAFGKDSQKTTHECMSGQFTAMSHHMHSPFMNVFESMSKALENAGSMIGDMSFVSGNVAGSFGGGFSKVLGQLGNVGATVQFLIIKIETLLQRLVATVAVIMYSMSSILQGVLAVQEDEGLHKMIDKLL
jgi:hypothetical protein